MAPKAGQIEASGHIDGNSAYTLPYLKTNFGMGTHAMRKARRQGLKVRYIGRRGYVLGCDLIQHLVDAGK